jgi:hypothetical protein
MNPDVQKLMVQIEQYKGPCRVFGFTSEDLRFFQQLQRICGSAAVVLTIVTSSAGIIKYVDLQMRIL